MDGRTSLEEIAHKLVAEFPKRLSSWQEAKKHCRMPERFRKKTAKRLRQR